MVLWRRVRPSRTDTKKDVLFIIEGWNTKVGSQEIPGVTGIWSTKWSKGFYQENTLVIANILFQQHKRRLYTWTSPDGQYRNQIDYILCSWKWRTPYSQQTRPEADCGTDHEPLGCRYLNYILQMKIKGVKYFPIVTQPVSGQAGTLCCCESEVRLIT